jgi:outer membrane protein assembly factor BamE
MIKNKLLIILTCCLFGLQGCKNWIFRIDIPQGNFLQQNDIDKLRIGMTKEQVTFVLGRPVVKDAFNDDTWYYYYEIKRGLSKNGDDLKNQFFIYFEDGKIASVDGDYTVPETFYTPLEQ